jgi:hypothetical protein
MDDEEEDEDTQMKCKGLVVVLIIRREVVVLPNSRLDLTVLVEGVLTIGASLNSAVQKLTIHVKDNWTHPEIMLVLGFIESERMAWNMCHNGFE